MGEKIHEYDHNPAIKVIWKPALCIHSTNCVKRLPQVYHPQDKPWITPENATKEQLIEQIDTCPSGALSYRIKD